jgi:hypothetical protein
MKFLTAVWSVFVATITSVVGQTIVSPTPGQVLPANEVRTIHNPNVE